MKRMLFVLIPTILIALNAAASRHYRSSPPRGEIAPTKLIAYSDHDLVRVHARIRFTTLIVLPKNEQILDFVCGDKDMWIVNGSQNFASIKPAKEGSETNLNLITASGNVYSFVLKEVSETQVPADVKIFVVPKDETMVRSAGASPKFVSAEELQAAKEQIAKAQEETRKTKEASQAAVDSGISAFIQNVRFPYRFEAGKKPFFVRAMYTNDRFTYIQARPEETPALYELKDGKPNLVNFEYQNGLYVVNKVLGDGYLAIGKKKLNFSKQD